MTNSIYRDWMFNREVVFNKENLKNYQLFKWFYEKSYEPGEK